MPTPRKLQSQAAHEFVFGTFFASRVSKASRVKRDHLPMVPLLYDKQADMTRLAYRTSDQMQLIDNNLLVHKTS